MRLDRVSIELRPRSPWEAVELGTALVREHAGAIWRPWFLVTLPVFALVNLVAWQLGLLSWAMLLMWWLKPVFDRIPLFVVSRAVFGDVPGVRATVAAQRNWGWRSMLHVLTWRRLDPYRSLHLPVDLLEGGPNRARRVVIGAQGREIAGWVTLVFANFEGVLALSVAFIVPLMVPIEYAQASMSDLYKLVQDMPVWLLFAWNFVGYLAMSAMEPFYVGAGFGLYLNRRTQLEAWDVEIAFRRMRARLGATLMVALLAVGIVGMPVRAQEATETAQQPTMQRVFGDAYVPPGKFERAAVDLEHDRLLHPTRTEETWVLRDKKKKDPKNGNLPGWAVTLGKVIGVILESGLWIVLGIVVLLLLLTSKQWWPWLRSVARPLPPPEAPVDVAPLDAHDVLPVDIAAAARALWREGRARRALALLYRASVESMVARTGVLLVPGATEAECLRASRALGATEDRDAFASAVRTWQYAAYADRMPDEATFEALLSRLSQRFGWAT